MRTNLILFVSKAGRGTCSAHLINDGVVMSGNTITFNFGASIPELAPMITSFTCMINNADSQSCKYR